jgi:hypothetical protein
LEIGTSWVFIFLVVVFLSLSSRSCPLATLNNFEIDSTGSVVNPIIKENLKVYESVLGKTPFLISDDAIG